MFGKKFSDRSLNTFGKGVADYLDRAGEAVLAFNPVEGIPSIRDLEQDNSSYKQVLATTRFIFDCGVIWALAYVFLRDEEYKDLSESQAVAKTEENIDRFIKEGLKYVSKHDYDLPKVYNNHKTILNYELDSRTGGEKSPFNKGATFSGVFLKEYYKAKFDS